MIVSTTKKIMTASEILKIYHYDKIQEMFQILQLIKKYQTNILKSKLSKLETKS